MPEDATKNFECRLLPPTEVTLRHFLNGEEPREGETAQNYYDEKFVMREFVLPLLEVEDAALADATPRTRARRAWTRSPECRARRSPHAQ